MRSSSLYSSNYYSTPSTSTARSMHTYIGSTSSIGYSWGSTRQSLDSGYSSSFERSLSSSVKSTNLNSKVLSRQSAFSFDESNGSKHVLGSRVSSNKEIEDIKAMYNKTSNEKTTSLSSEATSSHDYLAKRREQQQSSSSKMDSSERNSFRRRHSLGMEPPPLAVRQEQPQKKITVAIKPDDDTINELRIQQEFVQRLMAAHSTVDDLLNRRGMKGEDESKYLKTYEYIPIIEEEITRPKTRYNQRRITRQSKTKSPTNDSDSGLSVDSYEASHESTPEKSIEATTECDSELVYEYESCHCEFTYPIFEREEQEITLASLPRKVIRSNKNKNINKAKGKSPVTKDETSKCSSEDHASLEVCTDKENTENNENESSKSGKQKAISKNILKNPFIQANIQEEIVKDPPIRIFIPNKIIHIPQLQELMAYRRTLEITSVNVTLKNDNDQDKIKPIIINRRCPVNYDRKNQWLNSTNSFPLKKCSAEISVQHISFYQTSKKLNEPENFTEKNVRIHLRLSERAPNNCFTQIILPTITQTQKVWSTVKCIGKLKKELKNGKKADNTVNRPKRKLIESPFGNNDDNVQKEKFIVTRNTIKLLQENFMEQQPKENIQEIRGNLKRIKLKKHFISEDINNDHNLKMIRRNLKKDIAVIHQKNESGAHRCIATSMKHVNLHCSKQFINQSRSVVTDMNNNNDNCMNNEIAKTNESMHEWNKHYIPHPKCVKRSLARCYLFGEPCCKKELKETTLPKLIRTRSPIPKYPKVDKNDNRRIKYFTLRNTSIKSFLQIKSFFPSCSLYCPFGVVLRRVNHKLKRPLLPPWKMKPKKWIPRWRKKYW